MTRPTSPTAARRAASPECIAGTCLTATTVVTPQPSQFQSTIRRRACRGRPPRAVSSAPSRTGRSDRVRGSVRRRCRQHAHRKRVSVTASVTSVPTDCGEVFRYVLHADVPRFTAEGWEPLSALDGTHHGEYSVLMRRAEA